MSVTVGGKVPDFTLASTGGDKLRLKDLLGGALVLYFYPRDNTPGCTLEGQQFAALNARFKKAGVTVFGVLLFHYLLNIPFPLLRGVNL